MSSTQPGETMTVTKPTLLQRLDATGVPLILARLALGVVFIYLAMNKLSADPHVFAKSIKQYSVLPQDPPQIINAVAIVLPWLELLCGVAVLLGVMLRGAGLLLLVQLVAFTLAIYKYGIDLFNQGKFAAICDIKFDCGCGTGEQWYCEKLLGNLGLIAAAVVTAWSRSRVLCLPAMLRRRRGGVVAAPATVGQELG